jgi:membrane protein
LINKLRDFGLILVVLLFFLLSAAVLPTLQIVTEMANRVELLKNFRFDFLEDLLLRGAAFMIILFMLFLMYFFVPNAKIQKKVALLSALATAIFWEVAKELFGLYIANAVNLKRIYGAYVLAIVVVFWIYYSSIVFILGAEIGQLYRERMEARSSLPDQVRAKLREVFPN